MSTRLINLDYAVAEMRAYYQQQAGEQAVISRRHTTAMESLAAATKDIGDWDLVAHLLTLVSEAAREQIRQRIESTVTAALQTVFGEGISFRVTLATVGGQPAVEWGVTSTYTDAEITTSIEDGRGGGVVDIISLALRLAVLELYRPRLPGPLVLDEPGRNVSAEYALNLARFLKAYSQETGRQILLITHNTALAEIADRSFWVTLRGGCSEVAVG